MATKIKLTKNDWNNRFKEFKKTDKKYAKYAVFKNAAIPKRLTEFEVAENKMDGSFMIDVLVQLESEFSSACKNIKQSEDPELHLLLKTYLIAIKDQTGRANGIIKTNKKMAKNGKDSPDKQKIGSLVVLWEDDFSKSILKGLKLRSTPPDFNCKVQLVLDGELLKKFKKERNTVTPHEMISDAQKLADETRKGIRQAFVESDARILESLKDGEDQTRTLKVQTAILNIALKRKLTLIAQKLEAIPEKHFKKWQKEDSSRKTYILKAAAKVGAIFLSTTWNAAKVGGSGGILLLPAIHTLVKNGVTLGKMVDDFKKQEDKIEARLKTNLKKIKKAYADAAGKASKDKTEMAKVKAGFFKYLTGTDNPWVPSIVSARDDLTLLEFKLNQQYKKALGLSQNIVDALDALEKAEKDFKKAELNKAVQALAEIKAMRTVLDAALHECSAIMERRNDFLISKAELAATLKKLEGKNELFLLGEEMALSANIDKGVSRSLEIGTGKKMESAKKTADRLIKLVA